MGKPMISPTTTWQPIPGATTFTQQPVMPTPVRSQRAPTAAQIAAFSPQVRPGYELQGPYNSMGAAAAEGNNGYRTRAELLAAIGGTPIAPVQSSNPYAANAGIYGNPYAAMMAARAANPTAVPGVYGASGYAPPAYTPPTAQQQAQMAQLAQMAPGMGINPAIIAAYQARQAALNSPDPAIAAQARAAPVSALYNFTTPQQMAARMGLAGMTGDNKPITGDSSRLDGNGGTGRGGPGDARAGTFTRQ